MQLLSQVIGHATDSKKALKSLLTDIYQRLQKASAYTGLTRTYLPMTEDGAHFPQESNQVQTSVVRELLSIRGPLARYIDDAITLNQGNTVALVDVVVEGQTIFSQVPPTFLMELKKQLVDLHTLVSKLPTLDPSTQWNYDTNTEVHVSAPMTTFKTQKVKKSMILAPATDKHPAQVTVWDEDVPVGTWTKVDLSGAIPFPTRSKLVERVVSLQTAVDDALASANSKKVKSFEGGEIVVRYILKDILTA